MTPAKRPSWLLRADPKGSALPVIVTAPHSGEWIPPEAGHLKHVPQTILLTDIDRFVNELYDFVPSLGATLLTTSVHRYAVDLNRIPEDVDQSSVINAPHPSGKHTKGFHWVRTTQGAVLIKTPLTAEQHQELTRLYYQPFIDELQKMLSELKKKHGTVYHLDVHSMPSLGTDEHVDPGEQRKDAVISDHKGRSCSPSWLQKVVKTYAQSGFDVAINWPYTGGRLSGLTGNPSQGVESIQIELNRKFYMDESSREKNNLFTETRSKIKTALTELFNSLKN